MSPTDMRNIEDSIKSGDQKPRIAQHIHNEAHITKRSKKPTLQ